MKDGVELTRDTGLKYRFKKDGKKHILIINEASKEDTARYKVMTNGGESKADLVVEGTQCRGRGRGWSRMLGGHGVGAGEGVGEELS